MSPESVRLSLIRRANEDHAHLPQYKGHWDGWVLVRTKKNIRTKMGLAFGEGELAIADPEVREFRNVNGIRKQSRTLYSVRNRCDTAVMLSDIEPV